MVLPRCRERTRRTAKLGTGIRASVTRGLVVVGLALTCDGVGRGGEVPVLPTWKGVMTKAYAWGNDTVTFYARKPAFRVERSKGPHTLIKMYDGQDFYEWTEGRRSAQRTAQVKHSSLWKWASWWSMDMGQYGMTAVTLRTEPYQGKVCRYVEFPDPDPNRRPVKEWIWPEAGMVLHREFVSGGSTITTDVTGLETVAHPDPSIFQVPAGMIIKSSVKGRDPSKAWIDRPLPPFALKVAGADRVLDSTALKGKIVVLNFFATWCGPCRQETPDLVEIFRAYRGKGVEVVSIDVGETAQKDPEELVAQYVKTYGVTWPVLMDEEYYHIDFSSSGVPINFILDRDGIVRASSLGATSQQWFRDHLNALLDPSTPPKP